VTTPESPPIPRDTPPDPAGADLPPEALPIRRNTFLLSAALAANSGMLQLSAAVASLTLVLAIGVDGLLGLGPAIVLASGALAALPAGRAMDRFGRVPVLALGFGVGGLGGALAALGSATDFAPPVLLGLVCVGAASGTALLARTAAGDMYPPERRARGIALVLFGAVFGAILGPAVFSPLLAGRDLDGDSLALLWLAGTGFTVVGLVLVLAVRPDPRRIAELLHAAPATPPSPPDAAPWSSPAAAIGPNASAGPPTAPAAGPPIAPAAGPPIAPAAGPPIAPAAGPPTAPSAAPPIAAPLKEIVRRPGVVPALLAAQASFAVMVGVMTLTGAIVVDHHGHAGHTVFPIIGAHVVGMYALVLVVGEVIDRIGRTPALSGGLLVMGASVISLLWVEAVPAVAAVLFGLGLGWNLSFVAATAALADCTQPWERGKLLGFNDLLSGLTGAGLALLGGLALTALGVAALAIGAATLVVLPALWLLRRPAPPAPAEAGAH
jgi:MFS family permease